MINIIRIIVNWLYVLSSPFWILPALFYFFFHQFPEEKGLEIQEYTDTYLRGKEWFWE